MKMLPSIRKLDALGSDAGPYMDACFWELERAIASAASETDRMGLERDLRRLERRHIEYFGEAA